MRPARPLASPPRPARHLASPARRTAPSRTAPPAWTASAPPWPPPPGIRATHILDDAELQTLLRPWLGTTANSAIPLPAVIEIQLTSDHDIAHLATQLDTVAPGTLVEAHDRWLTRLTALARSLQACAALALAVVAFVAVAVIAVATRAGLASRRDAIETVYGLGATDNFIARSFAQRATILAGIGAGIGTLAALPVLAGLVNLAAPFGNADAPSGILATLAAIPPTLWLGVVALPAAGRPHRLDHRPAHRPPLAPPPAMTSHPGLGSAAWRRPRAGAHHAVRRRPALARGLPSLPARRPQPGPAIHPGPTASSSSPAAPAASKPASASWPTAKPPACSSPASAAATSPKPSAARPPPRASPPITRISTAFPSAAPPPTPSATPPRPPPGPAQTGLHTLIVVTAGYHMARALREITRDSPDLVLYAGPRPLPRPCAAPTGIGSLRLMTNEYDKFLAAYYGLNRVFRDPHPQ